MQFQHLFYIIFYPNATKEWIRILTKLIISIFIKFFSTTVSFIFYSNEIHERQII